MAKARVLVVDDEPGILSLVSRALSRRGYEVHAASNPLHALQMVHDTPCFDLVVSDVVMPHMCGTELVKRVSEVCPRAAVVVMSAHIDIHILPRHAKFIGKPFALPDLYSIVERALAPPPSGGESQAEST